MPQFSEIIANTKIETNNRINFEINSKNDFLIKTIEGKNNNFIKKEHKSFDGPMILDNKNDNGDYSSFSKDMPDKNYKRIYSFDQVRQNINLYLALFLNLIKKEG